MQRRLGYAAPAGLRSAGWAMQRRLGYAAPAGLCQGLAGLASAEDDSCALAVLCSEDDPCAGRALRSRHASPKRRPSTEPAAHPCRPAVAVGARRPQPGACGGGVFIGRAAAPEPARAAGGVTPRRAGSDFGRLG